MKKPTHLVIFEQNTNSVTNSIYGIETRFNKSQDFIAHSVSCKLSPETISPENRNISLLLHKKQDIGTNQLFKNPFGVSKQ